MKSEIRSVVIGTAGHIDHGKTALVKALTGIDTDRLPEEKRRGITVDLGFASLETKDGEGRPVRFSFVDVPGHHLFIHNMLAGAAGIDRALLVISSEEGVKPQTIEHLRILELLGIKVGVVALTKSDLVSRERLLEIGTSLKDLSNIRDSTIIPVSAKTGAGIPELLAGLKALVPKLLPRNAQGLLHLPVDRAFVMRGFGTVVTGTLQSGTLSRGQTVEIQPGSRKVRVRGLQIHGGETEAAQAGSRVAVNLANVEVADIQRGQALVQPETYSPAQTLDVELYVLPDAPPLRHRAPIHFHAFTSAVDGKVLLYDQTELEPGQRGLARLKLSQPLVISAGHRFVLRQWSPLATIGGGIVLDAYSLARLPKAKRRRWLADLMSAPPEQALRMRIARRPAKTAAVEKLMAETGATREEVSRVLNQLAAPTPVAPKAPAPVNGPEQQRLTHISAVYASAGLNSPPPEEVAASLKIPVPEMRKLMTLLLREKVLIKIGLEELYLHKDVLIKLQTQLQKFKGRWFDVAAFKDLTGLTRKRAIPLLEHFDRNRVTRREGDKRFVL